jgi:hypothetical protein
VQYATADSYGVQDENQHCTSSAYGVEDDERSEESETSSEEGAQPAPLPAAAYEEVVRLLCRSLGPEQVRSSLI